MSVKYYWCKTCKDMNISREDDREDHDVHDIVLLNDNVDDTIAGLDRILEFGLESLQEMSDDAENARTVKRHIDEMKCQFTDHLNARIEKIIAEVRLCLERNSEILMGDVEQNTIRMENRATKVIEKSKQRIESASKFVKNVVAIIPDEKGNITQNQIKKLYAEYNALEKSKENREDEVHRITVNIKFPNSTKTKKQCSDFAMNVLGEIEHVRNRGILDPTRPSINVLDINVFTNTSESGISKTIVE